MSDNESLDAGFKSMTPEGGFKPGELVVLSARPNAGHLYLGSPYGSKVLDKLAWRPCSDEQAKSRLKRTPPKVKIVKQGRSYTKAGLTSPIPHSWLFNTKRAAKKFFTKPLFVQSSRQAAAVYGSPIGGRKP